MYRLMSAWQRKTASIITGCLFLFVFVANADEAEEISQKKAQLEQLQARIVAQIKSRQQKQTQLGKIEQDLTQTEQKVAAAARDLHQTRQKIQAKQQQIEQLKKQQEALLEEQKRQLVVLKKQIQSAYQMGQTDFVKMLLNQESSQQIERMLSYYQYFNQARVAAIETLQTIQNNLQKNRQQLASQAQLLNKLQQEQLNRQASLTQIKKQQQLSASHLQTAIEQSEQKIARLKGNQSALQNTIEALKEAIATLPQQLELNGLQHVKGRLLWPAEGPVERLFGAQRSGQVRWKGIRINAQEGTPVRSIYAGQVVFSDWLNGYGLVIVIDHGDGFMSLYGSNQAVLKTIGETVQSGEPIALVGQSGGQLQAGVYFEIRHQGTPLNPVQWCR